MRLSLLYNPFDLVERLANASQRRRRLRKLRGTPAATLTLGHIDSLELLEILTPSHPRVIYDIGANIGTWSVLAKAILPSAKIEAFEPLSQHFEEFRRLTAPWPNDVRLHTVALGAAESVAAMNVLDFSDASSFLPPATEMLAELDLKQVAQEKIRIQPLDTYAARENLPLPDLLKLDVQGYELEVLRGGEKCLRHASAVLIEVSFKTAYAGQPLFAEVVAFLRERGFALHAFGENILKGQALSQADALFLRVP